MRFDALSHIYREHGVLKKLFIRVSTSTFRRFITLHREMPYFFLPIRRGFIAFISVFRSLREIIFAVYFWVAARGVEKCISENVQS